MPRSIADCAEAARSISTLFKQLFFPLISFFFPLSFLLLSQLLFWEIQEVVWQFASLFYTATNFIFLHHHRPDFLVPIEWWFEAGGIRVCILFSILLAQRRTTSGKWTDLFGKLGDWPRSSRWKMIKFVISFHLVFLPIVFFFKFYFSQEATPKPTKNM